MQNYIVGAILAIIVISITVKMVKDRKSGKAGCGCACSFCAHKDSCHK